MAFYQQSLDIARVLGDPSGEGAALNNLGNAHYSLGDYDKAINYYQQDLAISEELEDELAKGETLAQKTQIKNS
ncbi:tetratricopeptide repeat-containing protein [Coleofasciculus sp. LEGE 07092]|nr:tetratricopeptide repeat-containing protein [Coleofasciculus sp. LEGE 07081]MBE9148903.1 tetratricopeptide repeat-containing protein [Coleofasciculus sp. LEGE 07092]